MKQFDLIESAVTEWQFGKLTAEQAMLGISLFFKIKKRPSKAAIEWAKRVYVNWTC